MKNKVVLTGIIIVILIIAVIIGVRIYNESNGQKGLDVSNSDKPALEVDVFKADIKVGKAKGVISSWKYDDSIATSSLVTAKTFLEKEKFLENVKAGDIVKLSTESFEAVLIENIYQITYNAMDDEENYILPIDEVIDYSSQVIEVPILRANTDKTLYYHVTVNIKNKGTVVYYFKVQP